MAASKSRRAKRDLAAKVGPVKLPDALQPAFTASPAPIEGDTVVVRLVAPTLARGPADVTRDLPDVSQNTAPVRHVETDVSKKPAKPDIAPAEDLQLIECEMFCASAPPGYFEQFVQATWPLIERLVEAATRRSGGRYDTASVYRAVMGRHMQLWLALAPDGRPQGVMCTALIDYPTGFREAQISLVAGRGIPTRIAKYWLPHLLGWAKSRGANVVYYEGRKGFLRWGPWRQLAVTAEIRI